MGLSFPTLWSECGSRRSVSQEDAERPERHATRSVARYSEAGARGTVSCLPARSAAVCLGLATGAVARWARCPSVARC
ncbi:hypothetical protein EGU81_16985 [Pseudomonas syringae pv. theae]|nr:hypothetical protein [Pseudomonas syringae pv. theae]